MQDAKNSPKIAIWAPSHNFVGPYLVLLYRIAVLRTYTRPIVTDRVAWSVGRYVTLLSPTKTTAPIEMAFGLRTRVGPANYVLDGGSDLRWEGAILKGN